MINIWKKFFTGIKEIWEEFDGRAQLAVVLGVISAVIIVGISTYNGMSAEGCKAMVSSGDYISVGLVGLFMLFVCFITGGFTWWLILSIPSGARNLSEYMKQRRIKIQEGTWKKSSNTGKETFNVVSFVITLIVIVVVLSYLGGYLAWAIFC